MSENHTDCNRFESWLLDGAPEANLQDSNLQAWHPHLEGCEGCQRQWAAHQMLVATYAEEAVPELSLAFEARLKRKLDAAIEVKPLRGWRVAAMVVYALTAALLMRWVFAKFPLPAIPIDPASPWTLVLALVAVPFTLWLTIGATRWLPSRRGLNSPGMMLL